MFAVVSTLTAAALLAAVPAPIAAARPGTASVERMTQDPLAIGRAMFAEPGQVVSAELAPDGSTSTETDPRAVGVSSTAMAVFPTNDGDFGMISTGDVALAPQPNNDPATSTVLDGLNTNRDEDLAGLVITFTAPPSANCLRLDVKLLSEEYPDWATYGFNDFAAANINISAGPTVSGSDPSLPGNFVLDGSTPPNELEINDSHLLSAEAASGTTYDGATPILVGQTGIVAGQQNTLRVWAGDVGDSHFDTTLFMDNVRVFAEAPCPTQTKGPSKVGKIKAKASRGRARIKGSVLPDVPGGKVALTFFANGSPMKKRVTKQATLNAQSRYRKRFKVPADATRCKVRVVFTGDAGHFPSSGKKKFRC